jgi:selenoprotein W-related protein
LERSLGLRPQLIRGSGGVFVVTCDGETIFSKKTAGRFPEPGEIERAIAARAAP